jgi:divalent metal cation (Fe/Co/Zn/Cd) transporter
MNDLTIFREAAAHRGKRLEYFTIAWNSLEGLIGIGVGTLAGSISLVGFGIDSLIEVTSGATLLWRMSVDADAARRERNERLSLRIVGACFLVLAFYITSESVVDLGRKAAPERSISGIALAVVSLIVMPILSRAKKSVGDTLGSAAMKADARQTDFCVYLSAIVRSSTECSLGLVVGRSRSGAGHGSDHSERRNRRNKSENLLLVKLLA